MSLEALGFEGFSSKAPMFELVVFAQQRKLWDFLRPKRVLTLYWEWGPVASPEALRHHPCWFPLLRMSINTYSNWS